MSETRTTHAVFPGMTNHYQTLFGGEALAFMDSAAFIAATRYCRNKVVTAHTDAISFKKPVAVGTFVDLIARVIATGTTSMTVEVELWVEEMYTAARELACSGRFVLVSLDAQGKPTPVPPLEARA